MSTWSNYTDITSQLIAAGFDVSMPEVGAMKRAKVEGCAQKGWYSLHEITLDSGELALIGAYGWWKGAEKFQHNFELHVDNEKRKLTADQIAAFKKRMAEEARKAKAAREADARRAADEAQRVWAKYLPEGRCDYIERKGVGAHGLRFAPGAGTAAVPMFDTRGSLWGLQILRGKDRGDKLEKQYFPKGLEVRGHFHLLGKPGPVMLVAEGYATAASLFEATGLPVAVAFDGGNMRPVAEALHRAHRHAKLLICADDDYKKHCVECKALTLVATPICSSCGKEHKQKNTGPVVAEAAALSVGGAWIAPYFCDANGTDLRQGKKLTDFNDLAALTSYVNVIAQIHARINALGWNTPQQGAHPDRGPVASPQGGGERQRLQALIGVDDAAERFALVYGGKGTLFDFYEHALVPKGDVLDILPPRAWDDLKKHPSWRAYRMSEVGFDPAGTDPNILCNLYGGWPTTAKAGNCTALLDLLEFLCIGEHNSREIYDWVLKWLAYPIQHPGAKMKTALIFHGEQGAGKNLFFEAVMAIYGDYGRIIDQVAIEDKFNDWASRKLFLIADEVVARQELYHVKNKLKHFITGDWIRINPKTVAAHDEKNHVNIVFLSNEQQPLVLEKNDRRYVVVWVPNILDQALMQAAVAELKNGGVGALHHHLLTLDLGDFNEHTKPPMTAAKQDLIDVSMGSVERFVKEWKDGEAFPDHLLPFCPCAGSDLYQAYGKWCRAQGIGRPREQNQFINTVAKRPGWACGVKDRYATLTGTVAKRQRFILPGADDMEENTKAKRDEDRRRRPAQSQTEWLTACFFAFNTALVALQ